MRDAVAVGDRVRRGAAIPGAVSGHVPGLAAVLTGTQQQRELRPERIDQPVVGYPALLDRADQVAVQIFAAEDPARRAHRAGLRRLIALTTVPAAEFRSAPGGGIGMGFLLYGLTAPKGKLHEQLPELLKIGRSFKLSTSYEKKCKKDRAEDSPVLLGPGNSLKPVLDAMALVWEKRMPAEDMLAEKRADELQGLERLHRPATGEVYAVAKGFSAQYLTSPQSYTINDLRPLPDDPTLWLKPVLNGTQAITKK